MAELLERIQELQAQVKALQELHAGLQAQVQEAIQLTRTLATGMSGEDVRELQELLATDTELYPEGLVTGYYGPMTERAIQKLQARFGIEQVGNVLGYIFRAVKLKFLGIKGRIGDNAFRTGNV
jgi:peptidoglycan hydrolase-like protein with peptidoglycan-binding domain